MSKYIHVSIDDGSMRMDDQQRFAVQSPTEINWWDGNGLIYKVPDDFELTVTLKDAVDNLYIYELLAIQSDAELVYQGGDY